MAEFSAEQIEAVDLSDFNAVQRAEVAATLYTLAPGDDSLDKRRWVADRLRVRISEVNPFCGTSTGLDGRCDR